MCLLRRGAHTTDLVLAKFSMHKDSYLTQVYSTEGPAGRAVSPAARVYSLAVVHDPII